MKPKDNLPNQPYKRFFGRQDSLQKITETLIQGGTFIASIDGVGGIGKTALAYHFCKEILIPSKRFSYLIWLSAKDTYFDAYSAYSMIKFIPTDFRGIESLINNTFSVFGVEEFIDFDLESKKRLFEEDILSKEKVFFVLDNLENINDQSFFDYITKEFNKISAINRNFKVLTTSRRRKKIIDFPIEIEGLSVEDALKMLKYLATIYNIKDILNAPEYNNIALLNKVAKIPLGIEFIIGQMTRGKSRGQIYKELDGYPSLEDDIDDNEKRKRLSDIILFSFKNMYETLDNIQQYVFKTIAAYMKNKTKHSPNLSLELLMTLTNYSRHDLEDILDVLIDNKLITETNPFEYNISEMSINFVKQFYEDFDEVEDKVFEDYNKIVGMDYKPKDKVDILLNSVNLLLNNSEYNEAEKRLLNALDVSNDYRIHFELAKVARLNSNFPRASDSFKVASDLNPQNSRIWFEWINMLDNQKKHNVALAKIADALEKTNHDVSIVIQKHNIFKYKKEYDSLRKDVQFHIKLYKKENRINDLLKLVRNWKSIEFHLAKESENNIYFEAVEILITFEETKEIQLQLLKEANNFAKKNKDVKRSSELKNKIHHLEKNIIRSIPMRVKDLNKLFNSKKYNEVLKEAPKIISWYNEEKDDNLEYFQNTIRLWLQVLAMKKEYTKILSVFNDFKSLCLIDTNCKSIYAKANKMIEKEKNENVIKDISLNIQNSEYMLRKIILWSYDNDESQMLLIVNKKEKKDWIQIWEDNRNKALKKDEPLIHYSDLGHLRAILSWSKSNIVNKFVDNQDKQIAKNAMKKITAQLEEYVSTERNETFHSRLQLYSMLELNKILVDSQRLIENIDIIISNGQIQL